MSSASSAAGLLNNIQMAEREMALYAAIIGHRPKVEPVEDAEAIAEAKATVEEATKPELRLVSPESHEPRKITIWMRHVGHEARKRFDEAKMRLAS